MRELDVSQELLERLPAELRARIPVDWLTAVDERSGAAVSWRWAKSATGDENLRPLSWERLGWRPGRRRKPPAPEGTELSLYGYDARGRALIQIDRGGDGTEMNVTLLWHGERESVALEATSPRPSPSAPGGCWPPCLMRVQRAELDGSRPILVEGFGREASSLERCRWEGERLVEVTSEYGDRPEASHRDLPVWQGSHLVRIERHWAEAVEIVYEQLPPGESLAGLVCGLEDELVERIPAVVAGIGQREPICAMALAYCLGEHSLPPGVVLCPEPVRRRLAHESEDGFWYRWQAAEWMSAADVPELDGYGGQDFVERCGTLDRLIRGSGDELATARLLQTVARRLNQIDWRDLLAVTDDFLVYAWEIHGTTLEADLAASTPGGGAARA